MKNFRRFCFALLLVAAFTIPVFAEGGETQGPGLTAPGDVHTPGLAAPGDTQEPGDIHTPGLAEPGDMHSPGLALILWAVQSAL